MMFVTRLSTKDFINCAIENSLHVRALYDIGADVTCMSADAFSKIPIKNRPTKLSDTYAALGNASNGAMKSCDVSLLSCLVSSRFVVFHCYTGQLPI